MFVAKIKKSSRNNLRLHFLKHFITAEQTPSTEEDCLKAVEQDYKQTLNHICRVAI